MSDTHLNSITVNSLLEYRSNILTVYATHRGPNGYFSLGVNGVGQFTVRTRDKLFKYKLPKSAIKKYRELVRGEIKV